MLKPLNLLCFGLLLVLFSVSCTNLRQKKSATPKPVQKTVVKAKPVATKADESGPSAVWSLLNQDQITLFLKHIESGEAVSMVLEKDLNTGKLGPGIWEVTGFELFGVTFISMNTSKKFVFNMRTKTSTYAGSIVVGCPQVVGQNLKFLKNMGFFNRYPFSAESGLCEIIIGNEFSRVKAEFLKTRKKGTKFVMGF